MTTMSDLAGGLPAAAGLGLKPDHVREILEMRPAIGFFEVHAENYMGDGGMPHRQLSAIRELYPVSLHGVGLSIGGEDPLDKGHLARLKRLVERYAPARFSEHLAWSTHEGTYFNDLLPLPYTEQTLARVCDHVDEVQEVLGLRMLLENPSTYVAFSETTLSETEFLAEIAGRTGCGLLLDVNNVHVSCVNQQWSPQDYLADFPMQHVGEIHLGGHAQDTDDLGRPLLIDSHDREVDAQVWALFADVIARHGSLPTLIEWDQALPDLPVLLDEARRAEAILSAHRLSGHRPSGHRLAADQEMRRAG